MQWGRDMRHHVQNGQATVDKATAGVDEDRDRCMRIICLEVEKLLNEHPGSIVIDVASQKYAPQLEHLLVDIYRARRSLRCRRRYSGRNRLGGILCRLKAKNTASSWQ